MTRENFSLPKARLKKAGKMFEVVIDPRAAFDFKEGKILDVKDVLRDVHIFSDANRGMQCKEKDLKAAFGTDDASEIAKEIITKGDLPATAEIRSEKREKKRKELVQLLKKFGVDPRTKAPHTEQRIESALEQGKIKVDENRTANEQLNDIVKKLQPILPISFENKSIEILIPAQYAQKSFGTVKRYGKIIKDAWLQDGSWAATVEVPGGLENDFYDEINKQTQGNVETKVNEK